MASNDFARCPHCAAVIEVPTGFWIKLLSLGKDKAVFCRNCRKPVPASAARIMGEQFAYFMRQFHGQLEPAVLGLPILKEGEALQAMSPGLELGQVRTVPTFDSLAHFVAQIYRSVLTEKAHGRDGRVDLGFLPPGGPARAVCILGRSSPEAGDKETELLIGRVSKDRYLVYLATVSTQRVREAILLRPRVPYPPIAVPAGKPAPVRA